MTLADDSPRSSWAPVWAYLNTHSRRELESAHQQVQAELAEQEITGSVHDAEDGTERLWQLDSVPFVLDHGEWETLTALLAQRAQVLETVLQDLYGSRQLLRQDWFPRRLVYEHPGYLRPLIGAGQQRHLHCYAADLVRGSDGLWRVLADRCQAPYGLGYALQNRLVIGRSLPELFRQTQVQALAPFFKNMVAHLRQQAAHPAPRIALFGSPGASESNYEQAFLARYLDVDLVVADDLTVRNRRLWLKTLGGLRPIDVLLRFVHDRWADPLDLRPDSTTGVPGLVDAIRAGNLISANALGSGVVDSPGLLPYLDRCASFFNTPLGIESVAGHWCGDQQELDMVLNNLGNHVLQSAWHGLRQKPLFPREVDDPAEFDRLRQQLIDQPAAFAAVDRSQLSTAPAWNTGILGHHAVVMRLFLAADGTGGFAALPGGLVRCATDPAFAYYGIRHGGTSKDLWVPTPIREDAPPTPVVPRRSGVAERTADDLPSSRLDDLFWFGRSGETLDHLTRLLRVAIGIERDRVLGERASGCATIDALLDRQAPGADERSSHQALEDLVFGSRGACLHDLSKELGRLARSARAFLSGDTWLQVQELRQQFKRSGVARAARLATLDRLAMRIISHTNAITGTIADNMVRDHTWTFVDLGRRIQRGILLAELIDTCQQTTPEASDLLGLMTIADSAVTWRARFSQLPDQAGLLYLLGDQGDNPRSVAYQLHRLERHLRSLPGMIAIGDPLLMLVDGASAALDQRRMADVAAQLRQLADQVDHRWFSHALPGRSVDRSQEVR